jgi:hypothetical protein
MGYRCWQGRFLEPKGREMGGDGKAGVALRNGMGNTTHVSSHSMHSNVSISLIHMSSQISEPNTQEQTDRHHLENPTCVRH